MEHYPRVIVIKPIRVLDDTFQDINCHTSGDRRTYQNRSCHLTDEYQQLFVSTEIQKDTNIMLHDSIRSKKEVKSSDSPNIWRPFAWDTEDCTPVVDIIKTKSRLSPKELIHSGITMTPNFIVPGSSASCGSVLKRSKMYSPVENLIPDANRNNEMRNECYHDTSLSRRTTVRRSPNTNKYDICGKLLSNRQSLSRHKTKKHPN